ncbi:MSC_0882 family membrane protein [Mycoplasma sp. 2261]
MRKDCAFMELKPIITNSSQSSDVVAKYSEMLTVNNMSGAEIKTKSLSSNIKKTLDPEGLIPNGIYKVFRAEKSLKKFSISAYLFVFFLALISCLLFAFAPSLFSSYLSQDIKLVPWGWYVSPILFGLISLVLLILDVIDLNALSKSVDDYREKIKQGISFAPPFIASLYEKLMRRQVRITWFVVAILFYVGLFTLAFWGLKDTQWWILNFKDWIHKAFSDPNLVIYILCGIMLGVLLLFIIGTIQRKKRMVDIQVFFGSDVMSNTELSKIRAEAHKFWAKIFFISVLVLLVIPIIILLIVKRIMKRGR